MSSGIARGENSLLFLVLYFFDESAPQLRILTLPPITSHTQLNSLVKPPLRIDPRNSIHTARRHLVPVLFLIAHEVGKRLFGVIESVVFFLGR